MVNVGKKLLLRNMLAWKMDDFELNF